MAPPVTARRSIVQDLIAFDDEEVAAGAESSLVAGLSGVHPRPAPAAHPPATATVKGVGGGLAVGGIGAAILALDKVLRDHGETLESLTTAGPLAGALLQNWPIVLGLFLISRWAQVRWTEWSAKQKARDLSASRDRRATFKMLRHVASATDQVVSATEHVTEQIGALRSDLAAVSALAAATDARTREDATQLRRHVDEVAGELRGRLGRLEPPR